MTGEWRGPGYWLRVPSGDPDYPIQSLVTNPIYTRDEALEFAAALVAAANQVVPTDAEGD